MRKKQYFLVLILLVIGLFSLFLRGSYVNTLLIDNRYQDISLNPDSYEYIHLAKNIANLKGYSQNSIYSRYLSLLRTPGYPLFCALFEYTGTAPVSILWSQVIVGACIPVLTALLTFMLTKKFAASMVTGFLSSISTSSIILTGEIMVDLLFAAVFITGFFLLYAGIAHLKKMFILAAGLVFGISSLIKPTTIIWPVYSILIYYLLSKASKVSIKYKILALFVTVQIVLIGGWSLRNYYTERVFALSTIGTQTLRHYLSVEVNEVGKRQNSPSTIINSIRNEQKRLRKELRVALNTGTSIKKLHETQFKESIKILSSNLYLTYICYKRNITENISGPDLWIFYADRLPKQSFIYKLLPIVISLNKFLLKVIYIVILIYVCSLPWFRKLYRDDMLEHYFYASLALILTFLYFALISGITFWTGPRIVYPAEFALFILSVISGHCFFYFIRSIFKPSKPPNVCTSAFLSGIWHLRLPRPGRRFGKNEIAPAQKVEEQSHNAR